MNGTFIKLPFGSASKSLSFHSSKNGGKEARCSKVSFLYFIAALKTSILDAGMWCKRCVDHPVCRLAHWSKPKNDQLRHDNFCRRDYETHFLWNAKQRHWLSARPRRKQSFTRGTVQPCQSEWSRSSSELWPHPLCYSQSLAGLELSEWRWTFAIPRQQQQHDTGKRYGSASKLVRTSRRLALYNILRRCQVNVATDVTGYRHRQQLPLANLDRRSWWWWTDTRLQACLECSRSASPCCNSRQFGTGSASYRQHAPAFNGSSGSSAARASDAFSRWSSVALMVHRWRNLARTPTWQHRDATTHEVRYHYSWSLLTMCNWCVSCKSRPNVLFRRKKRKRKRIDVWIEILHGRKWWFWEKLRSKTIISLNFAHVFDSRHRLTKNSGFF